MVRPHERRNEAEASLKARTSATMWPLAGSRFHVADSVGQLD